MWKQCGAHAVEGAEFWREKFSILAGDLFVLAGDLSYGGET
jgi:hypothetical protein